MLDPMSVKHFYDNFGARQDQQAFYEDAALDVLFGHSDFAAATSVVEFGCGTGRFAGRVLAAAPAAMYVGFDVSTTMLELARRRLAAFGSRARVEQLPPGAISLPPAAGSADRVVSTYVLDLLAEDQIEQFLVEARRLLTPTGRLCLVSLTNGTGLLSGMVSQLWTVAFGLYPAVVGGCRPIRLTPLLERAGWRVLQRDVVTRWGITSEVLVGHAA